MGRFNVDTSVFSFVESVLSFSMICWFGSLKAFAHRVRYKQITQYPKMFKSKLVSLIYTPKVLRFAKYLSLHTRGEKKKSTSACPDVLKQEEEETDSGFIQISREFYGSVQ